MSSVQTGAAKVLLENKRLIFILLYGALFYKILSIVPFDFWRSFKTVFDAIHSCKKYQSLFDLNKGVFYF